MLAVSVTGGEEGRAERRVDCLGGEGGGEAGQRRGSQFASKVSGGRATYVSSLGGTNRNRGGESLVERKSRQIQ